LIPKTKWETKILDQTYYIPFLTNLEDEIPFKALFGYNGIEVYWGVLKGIEKKLVHITLQYTTYHLNPLQY
jgi:hypothetical protein